MARTGEHHIRVVVVDDDASVRGSAERACHRAGSEVVVASDGPEALRLVKAQPRPSDLFVVDVVMPEMRGDELNRHPRQRDPDVKVLYFTGCADRLFEDRKALGEHEAFVEKPVRSRDRSKPCPCCCSDTHRRTCCRSKFGSVTHTHRADGSDEVRRDERPTVRDYDGCFIVTAGTLFESDAVVDMLPFVHRAYGPRGLQFKW
jgi:CheY-like chemotaxis protein